MEIIQDKFQRHEIKFLINSVEKKIFLRKNDVKSLFPNRIVESIYFDTDDLKFFNLSEEGVTPRIKVRIRGYDNGELNNLEIKTTKNHHRQKIVLKNFKLNNFELHKNLKKFGINEIVSKKIRVKYLRNYYYLQGVGRITIDENIEFFSPDKCYHNSKKIDKTVMEIKIQKNKFDKNSIEKVINFRESRFSKYCTGVSCLFK